MMEHGGWSPLKIRQSQFFQKNLTRNVANLPSASFVKNRCKILKRNKPGGKCCIYWPLHLLKVWKFLPFILDNLSPKMNLTV